MKTKFFFSVTAICALQFAVLPSLWEGAGMGFAQNNNQQLGPIWDKDQPSKNIFQNLNYNNVGIGTITPSEKLHVFGNLKVEGKIIADSMRIARILSTNDSVIRFGDNSISINYNGNVISWSPTKGGCIIGNNISGYGGLAIANGNSAARGTNSMVFGNNVNVPCFVPNAFAMGNGVTNSITNSFQLGWGGTTIFADATGVGINNLTSHTQTLDVNGTANIRTVTQNNTLNQVLVRDPSNLGLIQWRDASNLVAANAWVLGGNLNAGPFDILGATFPGIPLNIWASAMMRMNINPSGNVGIGANYVSNAQLLDVDGGNIDVNTPQLGYMIGDQYVLWHKGDVQNIFTGVGAGFNNATGTRNTFTGNGAGFSNVSGTSNTYIGYYAGYQGIGISPAIDSANVFLGAWAGYNNQSSEHVFIGHKAGFTQNSVTVEGNVYIGSQSGSSSTIAGENCFVGFRTGVVNQQSANTFVGFGAGSTNVNGSFNAFFGVGAGNGNVNGNNNTYLGGGAGPSLPNLNNTASVGAGTVVTASNKMILGDTSVMVGIGLNNDIIQFGPQNKLEINVIQGTAATNDVDDIPGASGLRFRDLTNASTTVPNDSNKVLSVDLNGDVILVPGGAGGFGQACGAAGNPGQLTQHTEVPTNNFNFVFTNNQAQASTVNNVGIGLANANCSPVARLDVLQTSTSTGTRGINVVNQDNSGTTSTIGIKSYVNAQGSASCSTIAGWFESDIFTPPGTPNMAIVVPKSRGKVSIGFAQPTTANPNHCFIPSFPAYTLELAGSAIASGGSWQLSDENFKTDIQPISNGLNKIRNLQGVSFKWIPSHIADSAMNGTHLGFLAQQIDTVIPEAVRTENNGIKSISYSEIIPVTVEAIKQLDSAVTVLQNNPVQVTANNGLTVTPSTNNVQLGGTLNQNTAINLNNTDLIFSEPITPSLGTNKVSIGSPLPWSKFSVNNVTDGGAGYFATSTLNPTGWNVGVTATAENGSPNLGGRFVANNGAYNLGLTAEATNGSYANFGIRASASSTFAGAVNHAGYFDGDVAYTGTLYQASDSILKENIAPINDAINIISQLEPETFYFKTSQYPYLNLPAGKRFGLTAQQVETVLPEMVTINMHPGEKDLNGNTISPELIYKGVNYTDLIPILIQGMKEQQQTIQSLQSAVGSLQSIVSECCSTNVKTTSSLPSTDAELASASAILYQNIPNPFGDGTVIRYFVPENSTAVMKFFDTFGNSIKTVELPHKGTEAKLNLSTPNLASGIYSYSLVVNGKIVDTKKMLKTK